jgi:voltage-gated potassium channel Kch
MVRGNDPAPVPPGPPLTARLRYAIDRALGRGPVAIIGLLALASTILIVVVAFVVAHFNLAPAGISPLGDGGRPSFIGIVWYSLMRTLDAGTMGNDTGHWSFLLAMLAVTLGGVFVISSLIGAVTGGIAATLAELGKGRSPVLERGHVLVLGWGPQAVPLIAELVAAGRHRRRPRVVVLAPRDKAAMEDELRTKVGSSRPTRLICRTGDPLDPTDLARVSPAAARAIVVLAPAGADPGAHVVKALLALTTGPAGAVSPLVAELQDETDVEAARLAGGPATRFVVAADIVARIIAQTSRQAGLSVVYTELLSFVGEAVYLCPATGVAGKRFGAILLAYGHATVIGLRTADGIRLNPPMDTIVGPDEEVIAIATNPDAVQAAPRLSPTGDAAEDGTAAHRAVDAAAIRTVSAAPRPPERTLILGWHRRAWFVVRALSRYLPPDSEVRVVAGDAGAAAALDAIRADCGDLRVAFQRDETTSRRVLAALDLTGYDQIIVLPDADERDVPEADARVLITLLHLRDLLGQNGRMPRLVSEVLDPRDRALAAVTGAVDFVVSPRLTSQLLAQIADDPDRAAVFADLLSPEGSELYLKPIADYVATGRPVTFATVVEAARRRGEVAIGYRHAATATNPTAAYGVVINPAKAATATFAPADRVVVLAEG